MSMQVAGMDVSRETFEKLELYVDLLKKWNPAINLVAKSTIDEAWTRHIVDSAQIYQMASKAWGTWADFGSGGGFPGAVIAILAAEKNSGGRVTLVESDQRKSAFLRNVLRETQTDAQVISKRIEDIAPLKSDVISARALADLNKLLNFSMLHGHAETVNLFPKGINWEKELKTAQESWKFTHSTTKSETDPSAVVLKIGELSRV